MGKRDAGRMWFLTVFCGGKQRMLQSGWDEAIPEHNPLFTLKERMRTAITKDLRNTVMTSSEFALRLMSSDMDTGFELF